MKKIVVLLISVCLIFSGFSVNAGTKANTIKELRNELNALKTKKMNNQKEKDKTQGEINSNKNTIYNAEVEIANNQTKIENAIVEIEQLNVEIADTEESIKNLVSAYQIASGENAYLEYVFNAKSYAELVYRYAVVEQILEYNEEQITAWEEKIEQNNQLQIDLAARELELENQITNLSQEIDSLGAKLEEFTEITMDINDEIKSTQELIDYYVNLGCGETQDLDQCVRIKGDTNFSKPLVRGTITSYYGYRTHPVTGQKNKFHSGIDIGGNKEGTSIYATANGMVGKIIRKASCGGNSVYIYHTINGKKYTSQYTHLLAINVKVGDQVTSNTVIGTVGGGAGTKSYDKCSTGAHLHFGIANGWYGGSGSGSYSSYSTYLTKLLNPKDVLGLPNKGTYWKSR